MKNKMNAKEIIKQCRELNKEYHYFNHIIENPEQKEKGKLDKIFFSIKDNICVKDIPSSAGSRIIKNYKPVFDATIIEKIKQEGGLIIGKTSQDEFGFGGFNVNVGKDFEIPLNPFDKERATGGSSGGAAGLTQKAEFRHVAISESTGGSIVNPACFCGVYGLCPTYGRISRYGLIDYANSLDKIGIMSKNIEDIALTLKIISGFDEKESTSSDKEVPDYNSFLKKDIKGLKIGIIKEAFGKGIDDEIKKTIKQKIDELEKQGAVIKEISLPLTSKYALPAYYILALSEASTNLARFCGMRYGEEEKLEGSFNEYFKEIRSKNFGKEAKRRIILGTFTRMSGYRDAYYIKSAKIRTMIIDEYKKVFKDVDVLLSPTMPIIAPKIKEIEKMTPIENYMMDTLTCGPNLAGLPHINIPCGFVDDMPIGIMLIGDHFDEGKILQLGNKIK